ncbi:unnamed protein product [Mesocestoides corti]|uniref:Uncharacterized protein n=1 Tax=Mesocestoides corti TaxID=53468 RepID=A0A0R3U8X4_MESCO|nr:unnamed protein product [Mesocestoides corti]
MRTAECGSNALEEPLFVGWPVLSPTLLGSGVRARSEVCAQVYEDEALRYDTSPCVRLQQQCSPTHPHLRTPSPDAAQPCHAAVTRLTETVYALTPSSVRIWCWQPILRVLRGGKFWC